MRTMCGAPTPLPVYTYWYRHQKNESGEHTQTLICTRNIQIKSRPSTWTHRSKLCLFFCHKIWNILQCRDKTAASLQSTMSTHTHNISVAATRTFIILIIATLSLSCRPVTYSPAEWRRSIIMKTASAPCIDNLWLYSLTLIRLCDQPWMRVHTACFMACVLIRACLCAHTCVHVSFSAPLQVTIR